MSLTQVMYQSATSDTLPLRPAPLKAHGGERGSRRSKAARSEVVSKLKTSYSNAARAFLHHRTEEAHALVDEAFESLHPPTSHQHDQLSSYRRKWDILRITLETTLYTSPASRLHGETSGYNAHSAALGPDISHAWSAPRSPNPSVSFRSKMSQFDDPMLLSPPSLLGTLHTRSLLLFTPPSDRPSPRYLPAAVLVAIVLASLKLDCPQVGRGMIDDWLANRDPLGSGAGKDGAIHMEEQEGYEKVIEVYCLHVLPRLNEWDYAKDFLDTEMEMSPIKREELVATLALHHAQFLLPSPRTSQLHSLDTSVAGSSGAPTPRAASPAPSSVSSHTAVPNTRSGAAVSHTSSLTSNSGPHQASSVTTVRQQHQPIDSTRLPLASNTIAIPPSAPTLYAQPPSPQSPTVIQLLKAVVVPYLRRLNAPIVLLAIVISLLGLAGRFGRKPKSGSGAEMARRRLMGGSGGVLRGLLDAVKMSGRGLV